MRVEIMKDATLTVKAGQIVEIDDACADAAVRLGFVAIPKEEKPAPKKAAKETKK